MAHRKHKRFSISPAKGPNSDINVTPLVDVVLVLLIIFMVVTPLLEKDIEVKVPTTETVEQVEEVPQNQLVVSITPDGQLKINSELVSLEAYVDQLKRVLAARPAGEKLVFFTADDSTNYGKLVAALDGAKAAGAETLGMMTTPPETTAAVDAPPPAAETGTP
jgi:biopolymer transport protein TolR